MKSAYLALLVLFLSLFASTLLAASYQTEYENAYVGRVKIVLYDTPCERGLILAQLPAQWKDKFQSAEIVLVDKNVTLPACWTGNFKPGIVIVSDEQGNAASYEIADFAPAPKKEGI